MLMLLFRVGAEPWAIATSEVREVVPLVALQEMSQGWSDSRSDEPSGLDAWRMGLMNYRGETIPVVDVSALVSGRAAEQALSTRIVVVALNDFSGESAGKSGEESGDEQPQGLVGLMIPQASATIQLEPVANVPTVNRYLHSAWRSIEGNDLVYRLATERVVAQIYSPRVKDCSIADNWQLQPLKTVSQPQTAAHSLNNGFSLKGA